MLSLACFVAVGLVLGLLVPLRAFVLFSFFALFHMARLGRASADWGPSTMRSSRGSRCSLDIL